MAAKRFQTRTEEEIEQLLHDKRSKSTNKATNKAKSKIWTKANLANLQTELRKQTLTPSSGNVLQLSLRLTSVYCSISSWKV